MLAFCFEGTSFVCWPSRDRVDFAEIVSISFGALKSRSCVDFTRSLEFGSDLKNLYRGGEL